LATSPNSFFSWLGRQVGHVKKAVQSDPSKSKSQVIYRKDKVEEQELPDRPGMKLRRTVTDEVVVERKLLETPSDLPPSTGK
jgi:hypothetical protein